jgi:aminopeptidase N
MKKTLPFFIENSIFFTNIVYFSKSERREDMKETEKKPVEKFLKDYKKPDYLFDTVDLEFDLDPETTRVKSTIKVNGDYDGEGKPLRLDGDELELVSIAIDGRRLKKDEYSVDDEGLTIKNPPKDFTLTIENDIHPEKNTTLEGLYTSGGNFCTQCEPEGFRRITYYQDHPDVMAKFSTLIRCDKEKFPKMLSNGNPVAEGELEDGRSFVKWEDPFPKPSYLYALVAGDLAEVRDKFVTMSGKEVDLGIFVEKGKENQTAFAMESIKNSMKWDEEKWGREYDLGIFNVVAVSDFNQGAMENKGLNIFNDKYVLADAKTATDADYEGVEGVIGHEYFHNWSGDRVTVQNWFNLTLKEGLTVFRDQDFSADMRDRNVKRIKDVQGLRGAQFVEDAGPLAHPIKPKSYVEMNNFYTSTVYEKGSEIIGMVKKFMGEKTFRKATDYYFDKNDGKAVSTKEWLSAMEKVSGLDLKQFENWYDQAGTPKVEAIGKYDEKTKTYELTLKQSTRATPETKVKKPFMMPMEVGLLDSKGNDIPLTLEGEKGEATSSKVLTFNKEVQTFKFENVTEAPVLSINRDFSAPVNMEVNYSKKERAHLMAHDSDGFNRWDAGQQFAVSVMKSMIKDIQAGKEPKVDETYLKAFGEIIKDGDIKKAFKAEMLNVPSDKYMAQQMDVVDVEAIAKARKALTSKIAETYKNDFLELLSENQTDKAFEPTAEQSGQRALKNTAIAYLAKVEDKEVQKLVNKEYDEAKNMTDTMASLSAISSNNLEGKQEALDKFYGEYKNEALVVNKWLSLQARDGSVEDVKKLMEHEGFDIKNPNKVRALIAGFSSNNQTEFHKKDGSGYEFLAEQVKVLDDINPMVAAKMLTPLGQWRNFDKDRQEMMKGALKDILRKPGLKKNAFELASKSLGEEGMKELEAEKKKEEAKKAKVESISAVKSAVKAINGFSKNGTVKAFVSGVNGKSTLAHEGIKKGLSGKLEMANMNLNVADFMKKNGNNR